MLNIVKVALEGAELESCRHLFRAYAKELDVDLCFQGFAEELKNPLVKYGPPGGCLLLAVYNGEPAGCVAFTFKGEGICEMKRLFILPALRKMGLGKLLVEQIIREAENAGYRTMVLDTLEKLGSAIQLYRSFGFQTILPYYHNPLQTVVYMQKQFEANFT